MDYQLDISSLKKAVAALERSLNVVSKTEGQLAEDVRETLRAGVIQTFEFSYELCWKFMKRWLELNISREAADGVPRIELFRLSAENRLIIDVDKWMIFHRCRNQTSHIYDADVAEEVFAAATEFLPYAQEFLNRLEQRL